MAINREFSAGIIFILLVTVVVWLAAGIHGLLRAGIAIFIISIILYIINKKSFLSRPGFTSLLPGSYRKAIKDLEQVDKKE